MAKRIEGVPPKSACKGPVAIDLEIYQQVADKLHRPTGFFACMSMYFVDSKTCYLITDEKDISKALTNTKDCYWIFHNALYDLAQIRRWHNLPYGKEIFDIELVEIGLFGGYYDDFSLNGLSRRWLNKRLKKEVRDLFITGDHLTNEMKTYSYNDAIATGQIYTKQLKYAKEFDEDLRWYYEIDGPAIWAFLRMAPIKVDAEKWRNMAQGFKARATVLENRLGFNPRSTQQTRQAIKEVTGKDPGGTNAKKVLEPLLAKMSPDDPGYTLIDDVLEHRKYAKLVSTYGEGWIDEYVEADGYVYPSWSVTGARTGRTACSNPNVMQIPVRDTPAYRDRFISKFPGGKIITIDVSQQEPRILAYFSHDPELIRAFENDEDIHQTVADTCHVNRKIGKQVNLAMSYGMSEFGLARDTGLSRNESKEVLAKYFRRFKFVRGYIETYRGRAASRGYVRTASGRRVWTNPYIWNWKNIAINGPIQGTAADQTKLAMAKLLSMAIDQDIPYRVIMQVHDEIVIDSPKDEIKFWEQAGALAWMQAGKDLIGDIPIKVDIYTGDSWLEKKE